MSAQTKPKKALTNRDIFWACFNWMGFLHGLYNWQRLQGVGFAHAMKPIIERLYTSKEDISAAMKRHLVFFNTATTIGAVIPGLVAALEEEKANGADITDETINGLKSGLMGPFAGLGDTLQQGLFIPITLSICIGMAQQGNVAGPILFAILGCIWTWGLTYAMFFTGYRGGRTAIERILEGGLMDKLTTAASITGLIVAGVMIPKFVTVGTPVVWGQDKQAVKLGADVLDKIIPGLLPLITSLAVWQAMVKRISVNKIVLWIFIIGIVGGWLKILS
jgi:mannose PTS system EIID component